ncbi:MAG: M15 family metallopeptidase [Acidobacteriota bacterium]
MILRQRRAAPVLLVAALALGACHADRRPALAPPPFQIEPARPVAVLLAEARRASPPAQPPGLREPELVELTALDPTIRLDIRYATSENFLGAPVYEQARAFLQRPAAEALVRANRALSRRGYGILVYDGYRPWSVTWVFWEATPARLREFVADPAQGSRHNRGCAVDVGLVRLGDGSTVEMPSGYDEMTERSHVDYGGGTAEQRGHRDLLRQAMEAEGFAAYPAEWWHYDYREWREYPILDVPFAGIPRRPQ